jgi:hypothetical protein
LLQQDVHGVAVQQQHTRSLAICSQAQHDTVVFAATQFREMLPACLPAQRINDRP